MSENQSETPSEDAAAVDAGLNPLSNDRPLEDEDGPEASTVDSGGGPNDSDEPAPDRSPQDERP